MTPDERRAMDEYFDRREYNEPSGWWIVPAMLMGAATVAVWVMS